MKEKINNQINSFSYIRAVSCMAIILLHTVFTALGLYGNSLNQGEDVAYRVVTNNLMWAVPCFLMVTGALLLNKTRQISYRKLFFQYILRVVLAIVVFVFIFSLIDTFFGPEAPGVKVFFTQMSEVFTGKSWSHMWYLYCLTGLYLLLPFYKKIVNTSSVGELRYLLVICVVFLSLLPILKIWDMKCGFYIHISSIYPFYFFAGYYLWEQWKEKKNTSKYAIVFAAGTLILTVFSVLRWSRGIEAFDSFFGYSSILVIAQACGLFALFMNLGVDKVGILGKLLIKIDENSFGMYLIHMILVRYIFKQMKINPFTHGDWLCIIGIVIVVAILSWVVTWGLKKCPVFKRIL